MFDFFLSINSLERIIEPYLNKYYFERNDVDEVKENNNWFQLNGLSHDKNKSYYDTNSETIFIVGKVFLREGYSSNPEKINQLKEILYDFQNGIEIHKKYKGNYCITILDKKLQTLTVVNSQLGLNHVYYYYKSDTLYVSNNLNHFKYLDIKYNSTTFHQKLLFSYVLSDDTFISGVKRLNPGEVLNFKNNSIAINSGFKLSSLFENTNTERFNLDKYVYLFNKSVKEKSENIQEINVSFTGGFDGRTIISSLMNQNVNFNSYSFGKYNGENTRIPLKISNKIGIKYEPIYLEEDYEKNYVDDAKKVIYFSDGMSFNERANYIYAFRKLSEKNNTVLSGLIGGETLRPVHLRTDYLNENYYQILYLNNNNLIDNYFSELQKCKYIEECDYDSINNIKEIIYERHKYIQEFRKSQNGFLYYLYDLMCTGFRMYYGTEIHFERQFCNNLTPYYDIDLLEYLFSTDYIEVFKNAFKHSKVHRWSGQKIYAKIIEKNYANLNKYSVDRGYPPSYLLNSIKLPLVPFLYYKRKKERVNFIDFDEPKWSKLFLEDFLSVNHKDNSIFIGNELKSEVRSQIKNGIHSSEFNKVLSLQTWVNL